MAVPWWIIVATVFLGLFTVATVVGSVLFFSGRRGSGVRRVGGSLAMTCGCFLVLALTGFIFLTLPLGRARMEFGNQSHHDGGPPRRIIKANNVDVGLTQLPDAEPADALAQLPIEDDLTADSQRPKWTTAPVSTHGDLTHVVIAGQQFATIEEARQDAAAAARTQLLADFEKTYGHSTKLLSNRLSDESLRTLAVRKEFVETAERDFGNFVAPMHRVWWQVELSPAVRSELYPQWRAKEQEIRTLVVAGNLALVTIGLAFVSWFTRKRAAVQPPPQPAATNPVVLGVGAAMLLAQRCRRWWK